MKFNFFLIFLALILLYLISPFFATIFSSVLIAYITRPLFKKIDNYLNHKEVSAFISAFIALTSFSFIYYSFFKLTYFLLSRINLFFLNIDFSGLLSSKNELILNPISMTSNLLALPLKQILETILLLFLVFYFLSESSQLFEKIKKRIKKQDLAKILVLNEKMGLILKSILKYFIKAIILGLIAYLSLSMLEISNAFELAVLIAISSLLPVFNVGILILFLATYFLITSNVLIAIILFIETIFFTLMHYNFDIIFKFKKDINPLVFFAGIIVGVFSLGIFGFIAGPVLAGFIQALYESISE